MPSLQAPDVSLTVGIVLDVITVSSTTDIWPGQIGQISKSGQTTRRVKVTEVRSATTFRCKFEPLINDDNFAKDSSPGAGDAGYPGSSASANLAQYDTGNIRFERQLVTAQPNYTKPPT
jgi:hypothetical protein